MYCVLVRSGPQTGWVEFSRVDVLCCVGGQVMGAVS